MLPLLITPPLPRYLALVDQWRRFLGEQNRFHADQAAERGAPYVALTLWEVELAAQWVAAGGIAPPDGGY